MASRRRVQSLGGGKLCVASFGGTARTTAVPASHTAAAPHRYPAAAVATQDRRGAAAAGRARLRRPPVHVEVPRGCDSSQ
jgi:hypothetical protein